MDAEVRQNYYDILEINENANPHEIRLAYEKAKATYSAENKALESMFTAEEAAQLRQLIEEAYTILSHQDYRNVYERRMLAAQEFSAQDLTAQAIKEASDSMFERVTPPAIESTPTENTIIAESTLVLAPQVDQEFEFTIANKKDWLGEDLKQVREYRDLSYDELTDITKINPWYIAAIEKMDAGNLPVEVFVRGYVLQVAKALGLKEKVVADSYMRHFRKKIGK